MAPSATNHTPDPRPTGDLEHLFRQKLGEAEVLPRQHVWEQLDHELLIRQNDAYRRRLLLHRWVAAACALLVLGCGSWLLLRDANNVPPTGEIAAVTTSAGPSVATERATTAAMPQASATRAASAARSAANDPQKQVVASAARQGAAADAAAESVVASVTGSLLRAAKTAVGMRPTDEASSVAGAVVAGTSGQGQEGGASAGSRAGGFLPSLTTRTPVNSWLSTSPTGNTVESSALSAAFRRPDTLPAPAVSAPVVVLAQTPEKAPQAATAMEELPEEPKTRGKWRLNGTYAASSYNPNIDFTASRASAPLSFGASPANNFNADQAARSAYQYGANEYRENLQAGPAQRVVLAAAYALNSRWTLLTGVEAAQQRASSKTSLSFNNSYSAFTGRPAADSITAQFYNGQRTTDFSYRTVGVPVAMRYGSSKTGWSLYAKVGAAVNVLLKSRTEVAGNASAARDYTLSSSDSPYRKVLTSVRGGGGVRYQPTDATWSLALGPVAEAGLNTLNQNPGGSFLQRARPYAVGLEASVEFGGQKAAAVH